MFDCAFLGEGREPEKGHLDPQGPADLFTSEVNLVVKLVKCTNSYEGQRAGDLRLEHVFTAQPADRKWRVLHKIPRFT